MKTTEAISPRRGFSSTAVKTCLIAMPTILCIFFILFQIWTRTFGYTRTAGTFRYLSDLRGGENASESRCGDAVSATLLLSRPAGEKKEYLLG